MADVLAQLAEQIEARTAPLAVIGLGYVGLPVACKFAQTGFRVMGLDLDAALVEAVNDGVCPIEGIEPGLAELVTEAVGSGRLRAITDPTGLAQARVALIAVPTPVDDQTHEPRHGALRGALESLAERMQPGTLVIVESTLAPGTMEGLVLPLLERVSDLEAGKDFWLGHCPERVMPGRLLHNIASCDRVVGGMTPAVAEVMISLYRHIVQAELDPTDLLTAELVKTGENAYRDVNIAFANEMALICEAAGADVYRVRDLLNKSPGRIMLMPGAGVGGECIPKDPWLLVGGAGSDGLARLVPAARAVNDGMPGHVLDLLAGALAEAGAELGGARVAVLGYAYLENSDDTRNSPSSRLVELLDLAGAAAVVHDPYVNPYAQAGGWGEAVRGCDAAVVMVAHDAYREIPLAALKELLSTPVLVDGRHVFSGKEADRAGLIYRCVGIGRPGSGTCASR